MLSLSRRPGEWIRIGDDIWIKVIRHDGQAVILGIDAPRDMPIVRHDSGPLRGGTPR